QAVGAVGLVVAPVGLAVDTAAQRLRLEGHGPELGDEVGAVEPGSPAAVERAVLRAVQARDADLDLDGQGEPHGRAPAGGLAVVAVHLVVEVKRLPQRRAAW